MINDGDGISRRDVKARRFADWAEEIEGTPGFGTNAGALGGAFVAVEAFGWEAQIHAEIRSSSPR